MAVKTILRAASQTLRALKLRGTILTGSGTNLDSVIGLLADERPGGGLLCPQLEYIDLDSSIRFTPILLKLFIVFKQRVADPDIKPLKYVGFHCADRNLAELDELVAMTSRSLLVVNRAGNRDIAIDMFETWNTPWVRSVAVFLSTPRQLIYVNPDQSRIGVTLPLS
jgi:hypothetical protein